MRKFLPTLAVVPPAILVFALLSLFGCAIFDYHAHAPVPRWNLVWHDEFDQPDGARPDPNKWKFDLGGGGWGNHELEYYTDRPENVRVEKGNLVITAKDEGYTGADGVTWQFSSARLKTQGKFAQAYGRFEARIKIPEGQGIWPAFWMLGQNIGEVGWPKCGEIDVLENIGKEPTTVHGSLHGPIPGERASNLTSVFSLRSNAKLAANFHVYAIEWEPGDVRFYLDDFLYAAFTPESPGGGPWVFDHPFFILLNVAVGGDWPGNPDATTKFPQEMLVDYVRVYTPG
jgi:beta-glucanase (GH16 family)